MSSPIASESSNARTSNDKIERLRVFQSAHGLGRSPDVRTNISKASDRVLTWPSPLVLVRGSRNAGLVIQFDDEENKRVWLQPGLAVGLGTRQWLNSALGATKNGSCG
ncbi:hypothetical protein V6N12_024079 [Hibiscus sabdariffa]|uniref:Uncharacterized protein n=1 Tax=Hibiscus sabdariffa TaxID=183260 RepID=A0ABR2G006_9ROSI